MAIIGQFLPFPDSGASDAYFSPWFPANGNALVNTLDLIATVSSAKIAVEVETKNSEDDDANSAGAGGVITLTGLAATNTVQRHSWESGASLGAVATQGCLELVRYKFTVTEDEPSSGGGVFIRMLNPSWLSN